MGIIAGFAVPHPPLIIPAVGRGDERAIQKTIDAYRRLSHRIAETDPDLIILSSPHAPLFRDVFSLAVDRRFEGSMARFNAPHETVSFPGDPEFARALIEAACENGIPVEPYGIAGSTPLYETESTLSVEHRYELDHASYIPLWFLQEAGFEAPVVILSLSGLPATVHRGLGNLAARTCEKLDRRAVWIASGDLSHKLKPEGPYGFAPEGPVFDTLICDIFESGELDRLFEIDDRTAAAAAECGLRSFELMAGALDGLPLESELLSHEGTFGVGYGVASFQIVDPLVDLAERAIRAYVAEGRYIEPGEAYLPSDGGRSALSGNPSQASARVIPGYDFLYTTRAGAFVSLHKKGSLRGCIGTISACQEDLAHEIVANAVSACSRDPRFPAVTANELDDLEISVDVLSPAEQCSRNDLDPQRFGVIVESGIRRGLLLPDLEGVDSIDDQIDIARQKAGIAPDEPFSLLRFEVIRHTRFL